MFYLCIQTLCKTTEIFLCNETGEKTNSRSFPREKAQYGLELKAVDELLLGERLKMKGEKTTNHDSRNTIHGIIVMKGMGSYTGTRIGVSIANALAYGWNTPVAGLATEEFIGDEENFDMIPFIKEFLENPKWEKMIEPVYIKPPNIT